MLILGGLGGCISDTTEGQGLHAFSAQVRLSGTPATINFDGPHEVVERSGLEVPAYRFAVTGQLGPDRPFERTWYLDGSLREIVMEEGCGYVVGPCDEYRRLVYRDEGDLPPYGLGLTWLSAAHLTQWQAYGQDLRMDFDVTTEEGLRLVSFEPPLGGETETYSFTAGRLLPDGPNLVVESYRQGQALPSISALNLPRALPTPQAWSGAMFNGEDEEIGDWPISHTDMTDAATQGMASDACIIGYYLFIEERGSGGIASSPLADPVVRGTAIVSATDAVQRADYQVKVLHQEFRNEWTLETSVINEGTATTPCARYESSPWPDITYSDGLQYATSINLTSKTTAFSEFYHSLGGRMSSGLEPHWGLQEWRVGFVDASTGTSLQHPYVVSFQPWGERLLTELMIEPGHR